MEQKDGTDESTCGGAMETDIENILMEWVGGEKKG